MEPEKGPGRESRAREPEGGAREHRHRRRLRRRPAEPDRLSGCLRGGARGGPRHRALLRRKLVPEERYLALLARHHGHRHAGAFRHGGRAPATQRKPGDTDHVYDHHAAVRLGELRGGGRRLRPQARGLCRLCAQTLQGAPSREESPTRRHRREDGRGPIQPLFTRGDLCGVPGPLPVISRARSHPSHPRHHGGSRETPGATRLCPLQQLLPGQSQERELHHGVGRNRERRRKAFMEAFARFSGSAW